MHLISALSLVLSLVIGRMESESVLDHSELLLEHEVELLFDNFKTDFGKVYNSAEEEALRRAIFEENVDYIRGHNERYVNGETSYFMGINRFADWTFEEMKAKLTGGFQMNKLATNLTLKTFPNIDAPDEVDWRKEGYVTEVKDQRDCGSCWAFSTTGTVEGQHFKATGQLICLSEQQLSDCSWDYGNTGCEGGLPHNAYPYIIEAGGLEEEASYPYTGKDSHDCKFDKTKVKATISNAYALKEGDEENQKVAVAEIGPISCGMDAENSFMLYAGGIYSDSLCSNVPSELNHAVVAVGYGTTEDGQDYWIMKNSYGTSWGEKGYIRMSRNNDNNCGVATASTFPEV